MSTVGNAGTTSPQGNLPQIVDAEVEEITVVLTLDKDSRTKLKSREFKAWESGLRRRAGDDAAPDEYDEKVVLELLAAWLQSKGMKPAGSMVITNWTVTEYPRVPRITVSISKLMGDPNA